MALVTNIKGYINGNQWGVFEPLPTLLTYEEIIALGKDNALTELNTYPELYYNSLTSGDDGYCHLVNCTDTVQKLNYLGKGNSNGSCTIGYNFSGVYAFNNSSLVSWSTVYDEIESWKFIYYDENDKEFKAEGRTP